MSNTLIEKIKILQPSIRKEINNKLKEFENNLYTTPEQKFLELCFCILVANTSLEKTKVIWEKVDRGFISLPEHKLKEKLRTLGYRFYNKRASYIVSARKFIKDIDFIVSTKEGEVVRAWLVKNIKGIGWKEASHFLRNLGFKNFAILDRHVLKILVKYKVISRKPLTLSKEKYLEIEGKLRKIADNLSLTLAELDLYLFYLDTGKICEK